MKTPLLLLVAGALASSLDAQTDSRWTAFLGCWESSTVALQWVCVVPAAEGGASAVDLVTVADGRVAARERVAATGERVASERDGCTGWEIAEWSAQGQRVYLRSTHACPGGVGRLATGLMAMSPNGEWLYIQSVSVEGGQTGVRVLRYREASVGAPLPPEVSVAPPGGVWAVSRARAAAMAPLSPEDIVDVAQRVDARVLEAWLAERGEAVALDGKRLLALADAGVPPRVIDLLVALAYPAAFTKTVGARTDSTAARAPVSAGYEPFGPFGYDYGYSYGSRYGYGYDPYNGGWYPGGYPVIIVLQGGNTAARPHGRVVNGRGYKEGDSDSGSGTQPATRPSSGTTSSSGSGSSGSRSGSASSSGSSSGSGEQRTAKPRPQN